MRTFLSRKDLNGKTKTAVSVLAAMRFDFPTHFIFMETIASIQDWIEILSPLSGLPQLLLCYYKTKQKKKKNKRKKKKQRK